MTDATGANSERGQTPYWVAVAAVVLGLAGGVFVSILVEGIGAAFGASTTKPPPAVNITGNFLFDAAFVGSALYFTTLSGWMGRREFGYVRIPWKTGVIAFVLAAVGYYAVTLIYSRIFGLHGAEKLPSDLGVLRSTWAAVATGVFVCVAAPMAEEFFFRGFLFGVLRRINWVVSGRQLGPWLAAVIVAVLFGLAHFDSAQPQDLIPLGMLGFALCIVRWKTGSLYPCMALHSINNCVALGANEFGWGPGKILLICAGSLLVIALVTGPLSRRGAPVSSGPSALLSD
jgi:membrane protease YdiL (CAAX protease family)